MVPTVRLTFCTGEMNDTCSPFSSAALRLRDQLVVERLVQAVVLLFDLIARLGGRHVRLIEDALKSRPLAFQCAIAFDLSSRSARPISSSKVRMPSCAMIWRASSATKKK